MSYPREIRFVGLALVAVFLLGGIAAASASAAAFEATPSFPVKFTAKGGPGFLETKAGHRVACKESEGSGEVASATTVAKVEVKFKGCFAEGFPLLKCGTATAASGEITTKGIKGKPVDIDKAKTKAGILLEPEAELFAEFECEFSIIKEKVKVKGSVIGKVKDEDLNKFTKTLHLELKELKGTPEPNQVEEAGEKHVLLTKGEGTEPFEFEESGIQEAVLGETTTTALEGKEIKLIP